VLHPLSSLAIGH